jgi:type IV secretion system protein VirD4
MAGKDDIPREVLDGVFGAGGDALGTVRTAVDITRTLAKAYMGNRVRRDIEDERASQQARLDAQLAIPSDVHGSARWAVREDLAGAGYLRPAASYDDPSSILLGAFMEDGGETPAGWLHWDGEGHLMTVAPTRTGKSTMLIIPNLLRYRGSCIVLDPKGELYEHTSAWRSQLGPVHRIAPFEAQTHSFNPLASIRSPADARALADLMIPDDPHAQEYFRKDAIAFLNGAIQYVCEEAPPHRMNLAEVRDITTLPTSRFLDVATRMSESPNPAIRNAGNIVLGKNRERGIPSLRDTLNTELSIWDDAGVRRSTASNDIDFRALKDQVATVYITVPFEQMDAFAPFLRVLLATALDGMVKNTRVPDTQVLFVLDEFLSLGPFPRFRDAIRTHAGAGVRLWFFLQDIATLEEHYPKTWKAFFDATVRLFFGTRDPFTAATISELVGEETRAHQNTSFSLGTSVSRDDFFDTGSGQNLNVTHSVSLSGRRLLTPAEVVQKLSGLNPDKTREAIVGLDGVPPAQVRLVPYFLGERSRERLGQLS